MKTSSSRTVAAFILVLLFSSVVSAQSSLWRFDGGIMILKRSDPDDLTILVDFGGDPVCSAAEFDFGHSVGFFASAERTLDEDHAIELRYFGVGGWEASISLTSADGADVNTMPTLGMVDIDVTKVYQSRFYSSEMNLIHRHNDWLRCFIGFRMLELNEELEIEFEPSGNEFENDVDNHLYGGQIGLQAYLANHRNWDIDASASVGFYGNHADHFFYYTTPAIMDTDETWAFSTLFECSLTGTYQVNDTCSIRGGFHMLWLNQVALASNQIPITQTAGPTAGITTDGNLFLHGISLQLVFVPR